MTENKDKYEDKVVNTETQNIKDEVEPTSENIQSKEPKEGNEGSKHSKHADNLNQSYHSKQSKSSNKRNDSVQCNYNVKFTKSTSSTDTDVLFEKFYALAMDFHDHENIHKQRTQIIYLLCIIVIYVGIQLGLFSANFVPITIIDATYTVPFHLLEFWAVFIFTLLQAFILISTGTVEWTDLLNKIQFVIIISNILTTLIAAILVSLDLERYEKPSHYLEFVVQIIISLVDYIFIVKSKTEEDNEEDEEKRKILYRYRVVKLVAATIAVALAVLTLLLYAEFFHSGIEGERAAHFGEYSNETLNGLFIFWFSLVNYNELNRQKQQTECNLRRRSKTYNNDQEEDRVSLTNTIQVKDLENNQQPS